MGTDVVSLSTSTQRPDCKTHCYCSGRTGLRGVYVTQLTQILVCLKSKEIYTNSLQPVCKVTNSQEFQVPQKPSIVCCCLLLSLQGGVSFHSKSSSVINNILSLVIKSHEKGSQRCALLEKGCRCLYTHSNFFFFVGGSINNALWEFQIFLRPGREKRTYLLSTS